MKTLVGMCVVAMVFVLGMHTAEAKGLVIINTGEEVVDIGEIKPELRADLEESTAPGVKLGMKYSRFGLFWLDIWRWDKQYVLYSDSTYWEITEEQAKEAGSISVPFTMTIPPGLIVLLVIGALVILGMVFGRGKKGDEAAPDPDPAG